MPTDTVRRIEYANGRGDGFLLCSSMGLWGVVGACEAQKSQKRGSGEDVGEEGMG